MRIHHDAQSAASARAVAARAYTVGSHVVFGPGRFAPDTHDGRILLLHELAHTVQARAAGARGGTSTALRVSQPGDPEEVEADRIASSAMRRAAASGPTTTPTSRYAVPSRPAEAVAATVPALGPTLLRWPGDGMVPPGDCAWATYLPLRLSVESAKAIVSTLGACGPGDGCTLLAAKIAAITSEIAARVALDTTCFRGGDTGHRQQVQDKVNMVNRCYRFFQGSNCPQALLAAMAAVIVAARAVIEATAVVAAAVVIVAAVAALIVAIIALAKAIAAAVAAAAGAVAVGTAVTAMVALLLVIQENLPSGTEPSA